MKLQVLLGMLVASLLGSLTHGAPGDAIATVNLPVQGNGVSVANDCQGTIFYTLYGDQTLHKMDKDGNNLGAVPFVPPTDIDEFAWDNTRQLLWGQVHGSNPVDVVTIDPNTGVVTFAFTSQTISVGTFRDGLAYDGTDDTIWISGDISTTIEHYQIDGTFINAITPKNVAGGTLGLISGVIVGNGDLLYLGRNGAVEVVQVKKSNGDFISSFASPAGARDEGLECDSVSFAPKLTLWSREYGAPGFLTAIELEPGTCDCGGGGVLEVPLDIKPGSCPNPIKGKGVLPAALVGTDSFDVNQVDLDSIELFHPDFEEGLVALPKRFNFEDVVAPYEPFLGKEGCRDCTRELGDGMLDLTMKFKKLDVMDVMNQEPDLEFKDCVVLQVRGVLKEEFGGKAFLGEDVVRVNWK